MGLQSPWQGWFLWSPSGGICFLAFSTGSQVHFWAHNPFLTSPCTLPQPPGSCPFLRPCVEGHCGDTGPTWVSQDHLSITGYWIQAHLQSLLFQIRGQWQGLEIRIQTLWRLLFIPPQTVIASNCKWPLCPSMGNWLNNCGPSKPWHSTKQF